MIALEILEIALKHKFFSLFISHVSPYIFLAFTADHPLRVSGRMENDTAWELKRGDGGFIEANGHRGLKDATE